MAKKTIAQLTAELEAAQAENERLKQQQPARIRGYTELWMRDKREGHPNDPDLTARAFRFIIPPGLSGGDPLWLDISMWIFDETKSKAEYKTPPDFTLSLSPCSAAFAAEQEAKHQEYQRTRGRVA